MARVQGKGSKKYGRNKVKCEKYKNAGRRERNRDKKLNKKLRDLQKHYPDRKYKIVANKNGVINIRRLK